MLVVTGRNVAELALSFVAKIKEAAQQNDFTPILLADRSFNIIHDDGSVVSTGPGVEREVVYTAFQCFSSHNGVWFLSRFDGRCSIATTLPLDMASFVNADRRITLTVLGCLTALLLIHGIAPDPLSPALIQYAANGCDLQSLTREFVGEWHPELKALLDLWVTTGPTGDISSFQPHFSIYHDMQIATIQSRDLSQHQALGANMLYTALIGTQPATHNEVKAFLVGLQLPCVNGFDFMQVLRSFPGGSATFISRTWTSMIHDYDSLQPHLSVFSLNNTTLRQFVPLDSPVLVMNLCHLLQDFLRGSGATCPKILEEAKPTFSMLIPWEKIDSPSFRPMILCWAATGSPHVEFEEDQHVRVHFVAPDDASYHQDSTTRNVFMKRGVISFRTCFRTAHIPVVPLVDICSQTYPTRDGDGNPVEPFTLQQAIDNWLLLQILGGIGRHSIL
ncbi:hypothetical protein B0H12DRAFT_207248 [Mycena haematopus]|nr:hypothetical protein B0H12DRAFT_207248 [Mycena haematopus]